MTRSTRARSTATKRLVAALLVVAALACAACGRSDSRAPGPRVVTDSVTVTAAPVTTVPVPATGPVKMTLPGMPPDAALPAGFTERNCPYLATGTARDLEGNRISRTAVSVGRSPATCRFYFWCCDYHAILEIAPVDYLSSDAAYNAMVRTGQAGADVSGVPGLIPGVDAVLFRTAFYGPDRGRDWSCAFAEGTRVVIVRTDQTDVSYDARRIAAAVAAEMS